MATLDANGPVQLQMNPIFTGVPVAAPPADVAAPPADVAAPAAAVVAAADAADVAAAAAEVAAALVAAAEPPELSLPHPADTATTPTATKPTSQRRPIDRTPSIPDGATPTPPHFQ